MCPVIRISDQLYQKLAEMAVGFDTPANVIERLINQHCPEKNYKKSYKDKQERRKFTQEIIEEIGHLGKDIYEEKLSIPEAQARMERQFNVHPGSVRMYLENFQKMVAGQCYKRAMNAAATDFFLKEIYAAYGEKALAAALSAVSQHVEYYESFSTGKLRKIRSLYETYKKRIAGYPAQV